MFEMPGMPGDACQDCEAAGKLAIGFDHREDGTFDRVDLTFDLLAASCVLAFQQRQRENLCAVLGGGAILDQGFTGDMELLEVSQCIAAGGSRFQLQHRAHASQHCGVQRVGFCELADRLGEAARPTRIDLDERNAGGAQRAFEGALIGAGRLEHDAVCRSVCEPFDQCFVTALVVGKAPACAVGQAVGVEMVFRDIDADGIVVHLFRASACHSGLSPGYPFRPKEKTRAIKL